MKLKLNSLNDGVDHINIYSQGKTLLGKALSNFALAPMTTEDGDFNSCEGYWFFLLCEGRPEREILRDLYGFEAKKQGRNMAEGDWPQAVNLNDFKTKIKRSFRNKIHQNEVIKDMLIKSTLPFEHYYVFNNRIKKIPGVKWICSEWELIRKELKNVK